ncbi:MAG: hypothetical protein K1X28_07070 [Parachlamydiales bacterium]|nr:hypothetical protein [Parachlamydiales bacterium]
MPIIPAVPAFSGPSASLYADQCAQQATRYLCEDLSENRFQMFLAIFKKQKPEKSAEYLKDVLKAAAQEGDEAMIRKVRSSFSKELEPVVNDMFRPENLLRIL